MKSIINIKWFSLFVIILIFFSLAIPSLSHAADADDRGGGEGESDAESEAEKEAAKEAAEAAEAAADAAEVSAAAAAAGVDVSVDAVSTAGPATPGNVSVNGVSMSKEAALGAIGAIGSATGNGAKSAASVGVDVDATFSGYASGKLSGGQVAGTNTGYVGTPTTVAKTEIANTVSVTAVDLATQYTSLNTAPTIGTMAPAVQQAPVPTDRMFQSAPIGTQPSSFSISFSGGFSMPGAPTPTSVRTESIATTPSSNPSYNSFDKSVPSYSPGITSVSVKDGVITGTYTDGSTKDLSQNEIDAINSNTPTPANTSWTSGITNTFNSVVSSVTNAARTLGSYVGLTDAPAPVATYTDLNSLADRLNATISAQALNDIGVEVTPGVVDALNANNINVTTAPNVNYGFVDKSSLTGPVGNFDSQYTSNTNVTNSTMSTEDQARAMESLAQAGLKTLEQRAATEAMQNTKDLTAPAYDPFAPGNIANTYTDRPDVTAVANTPTASIGTEVTPTSAQPSAAYDPFSPGQPANTYSPNSLTAPTSVNTKNIGTVPAPGPTGSFTGTAGVSLDDVTTIDVVNLSGSSNPAENAKAATPAQVAALGGVAFSSGDIAALGKAIAGEAPGSIVDKIASGQALTASEWAEVGLVKDVVVTRGLADKASLFGPFNGSLESVVTAGLTEENKGQFSAFNADTIDKTLANYNENPTAFDAVAKSLVDGTVAKTYGLSVAAPTPKANAYYNASIATPDWANDLTNVSTLGTAPHAHTVGSLPGEYKSVGQVEGVDNLNTSALSAMNKAATGGLVSGTGVPTTRSTPATPTNNDVSLPSRVDSVPSSRPTPSGVSLPDSVNVPSSRPSGGFVNTADNPGNINAPTYSRSISGTPSLTAGFTNTADNPGNINAPTYSASISGSVPSTQVSTDKLSAAYNEYAQSRTVAAQMAAEDKLADSYAEYATSRATAAAEMAAADKLAASYTEYANSRLAGQQLAANEKVADAYAEYANSRVAAEKMAAQDKLAEAYTTYANSRVEAQQMIDEAKLTHAYVDYAQSRTAAEKMAAEDKLSAAYAEYANSRVAAEKMVADQKVADAYAEYANSRVTAEKMAADQKVADAYAEYAQSRTAAEKMAAEDKLSAAYAEYANSRAAAEQMAAQDKLAAAYAEYANTRVAAETQNIDWDKLAQEQLGTLQARAAREALEARKDADLTPQTTDAVVAINETTPNTTVSANALAAAYAEYAQSRTAAEKMAAEDKVAAAYAEYANSRVTAEKMAADQKVADAYAEYAHSRTAAEKMAAEDKLSAAYAEYANSRVAAEKMAADDKLAEAFTEYAQSRTAADKMVADQKVAAAYAEYANSRVAAAAQQSFAESLISGVKGIAASATDLAINVVSGIQSLIGVETPIKERFAVEDSFYSPTLDTMVSNPINMGVNFDINSPPIGTPVSFGFDPKTSYTDEFGNTLSIDPLSGIGTVTDEQGNFQDYKTAAETMEALSDATFTNPAVQSYRGYADIAAEEVARIANEMTQSRISDAYAEYANSRVTAEKMAADQKVADAYAEYAQSRTAAEKMAAEDKLSAAYAEYANSRIAGDKIASDKAVADQKVTDAYTEYAQSRTAATEQSVTASILSGVKGIALSTAALARTAVDGVKSLLGIEAPVDERVVSTTPLDGVYDPYDTKISKDINESLSTEQTGSTAEVEATEVSPTPSAAPATPAPVNNSYYSPTLGMNITDNSFNAVATPNINTPTLGAPASMGFDPNTTYSDDQGNTMSVDPLSGKGTVTDADGNVRGTLSADATMSAIGRNDVSIQNSSNNNSDTFDGNSDTSSNSAESETDTDVSPTNSTGVTDSVNTDTETTVDDSQPEVEVTDETTVPQTTIGKVVANVTTKVTSTVKSVYASVVNTVSGWLGGNTGSLTNNNSGESRDRDNNTEPVIRREIKSLTIHLNIPVICPNVGSTLGYIYEAEFYEYTRTGQPQLQTVAHTRCGDGGPRTYATQVAAHLQEEYNFGPLNIDSLLEIMEFNFNTPNEVVATN